MANTGNKVSELPTAANVATTDRVMVLRDPSGNASVRTVTLANFANSIIPLVQNNIPGTTVTSNSVTLASNGTNNVAFFSYTIGSGRTGCCDISIHARDTTTDSTAAGSLLIVANTSNVVISATAAEVGNPSISFNVTPTISSNVVTVYFTRSGAATSNVLLRFSATIF
jgi:hypothetical protein